MNRTTKPERREAKAHMLTFKKGQRHLRELLGVSRNIRLPEVPHNGSVGDWVRHLRRCQESHHAWVQVQAKVTIVADDARAQAADELGALGQELGI